MVIRVAILMLVIAASAFSQEMPPIEPGVSRELAKWRAARYSDVRYKLNLTLEKMSPVLKGTIEIRVKVNSPAGSEPGAIATGSAPPIVLDWRKIKEHEDKSTISNVTINGVEVKNPVAIAPGSDLTDHLIFRDGVVPGENVIKLDFTSPILTSGSAITRYVDKEDGAEYIYSLFVPSDASTAFPVFDQPDLKARFKLSVRTKGDWGTWSVVSNTYFESQMDIMDDGADALEPVRSPPTVPLWSSTYFAETQPISTYVFAFAAGPFERVEPAAEKRGNPSGSEGAQAGKEAIPRTLPTGRVSASVASVPGDIYVRKSQAAKFQPHAAEVFRLNREGIKYLETYFDYKFPFPKYDIVLIPEFPFGGMEHAGATFLREDRVIFPQEPTKSDYITRANLIFHEAAHQWFGDTVTMRWFDDLWLKEGFAEFMAYKTLEKVMPEANAWKVFYERNKQAAYATDSTKGTTPIYQEIKNLSAAKSAYGNIVYRKAPSFLRQAEFYIGEDKFQTAVRAFLKKYEFRNAGWEDLVGEFQTASSSKLGDWSRRWIKQSGLPIVRSRALSSGGCVRQESESHQNTFLWMKILFASENGTIASDNGHEESYLSSYDLLLSPTVWDGEPFTILARRRGKTISEEVCAEPTHTPNSEFFFPNYQDYGYGIFLLDDKSREYVLKNIQNEKDDFLRSMMWGSLWDSVREGELDPRQYVELVVKNIHVETDESTIQTLLGRVSTAMKYYLPTPPARDDLTTRVEDMLIDRMQNASTPGQRITYYRSFLNIGESAKARRIMKKILRGVSEPPASVGGQKVPKKASPAKNGPPANAGGSDKRHSTKDKFDIVSRLIALGDPEAEKLLAELEKTETSDEARRYAYAARAGFGTAENKAKYWNDLTQNKDISESWLELSLTPFNSIRHRDLTLKYLEPALAELPNLKGARKIFFVNAWLAAFIGGQRDEKALAIVNKFLAENPSLDNDLRLKILENVDVIERAVKIRGKFGNE